MLSELWLSSKGGVSVEDGSGSAPPGVGIILVCGVSVDVLDGVATD